jgi:hypothetical protein
MRLRLLSLTLPLNLKQRPLKQLPRQNLRQRRSMK